MLSSFHGAAAYGDTVSRTAYRVPKPRPCAAGDLIVCCLSSVERIRLASAIIGAAAFTPLFPEVVVDSGSGNRSFVFVGYRIADATDLDSTTDYAVTITASFGSPGVNIGADRLTAALVCYRGPSSIPAYSEQTDAGGANSPHVICPPVTPPGGNPTEETRFVQSGGGGLGSNLGAQLAVDDGTVLSVAWAGNVGPHVLAESTHLTIIRAQARTPGLITDDAITIAEAGPFYVFRANDFAGRTL